MYYTIKFICLLAVTYIIAVLFLIMGIASGAVDANSQDMLSESVRSIIKLFI